MFTLTKALEKALLQHFIYMKVNIAYAINKPFPFFEALRDKSFITERMYKESLEACQNLVPLSKVVHNILTSLEQTFHPSVLLTLFSKVNLREYPSLVAIFRSFRNVGYTYEEKNRPPLTLLEDLANPAEGCSLQTLLPPPRPQISLPSHLSSAPRVCDPRATAQPIIEILDEQPSPSPRAVPLPGCIQEGKTTPASKTNDEQAEEMLSLPQCNGGEGSSSCEQTCDEQEPQDDLPSSLRQEAECVGTRRNIPARKPKKQRRKKKGHNWSKPKWRKPMSVQRKRGRIAVFQAAFKRKKMKKNPGRTAKIRGLRRRRKENANFSAELLPVTCGNLKGVLHKEKFKQGISVKSIQCQNGNWFTPSEFEMMGGYGKSKNWKLSLRCHNWPLKLLIQRNFLPNPPRIHRKRKEQRTQNLHRSPADPSILNSDECEVCRDRGTLFCCDTCFRAFHEDCHIPTVEAEITPWSCIFCRMQSLGSQPSLPESEILKREMAPQEQLDVH